MNTDLIAQTPNLTVVAEYTPHAAQDGAYQSEAQMEAQLISQLCEQGYQQANITTEQEMIANLRVQLETLNDFHFTDDEWTRFFSTELANQNMGIVEKTRLLQDGDTRIAFTLHDGTTRNILLLDKTRPHRNILQVTHQVQQGKETPHSPYSPYKPYEPYSPHETPTPHSHRYDITILVNGLPLVHIELKKRGVDLREAFNQIKRYNRDSFWAGAGLYEYAQLFVISNGTLTKYYSNTTREKHLQKQEQQARQRRGKVTSNSFEFTSYWATSRNQRLCDIEDFTRTFLQRQTLLNILCRYCIFNTDNDLLVMRPYQIAATEAILQRIDGSTNLHQEGTREAGGYIWHTTGSGKTLTSFKTAQLCSQREGIDKVLFVVDRKDLDYQTMKEYNRFQKGAADSTKDTRELQHALENTSAHIIITTIQKLSIFIQKHPTHPVYTQHVVMIFDECHRSQFGEMHHDIVRKFKRYHLFGFTGTPIFPKNAMGGSKFADAMTTAQTFGDCLHSYTIVSAIRDQNVLPFRIDYISTMQMRQEVEEKQVESIAGKRELLSPERISGIVRYTLDNYAKKTKQTEHYTHHGASLMGFNSIFCCESIDAAKAYYAEFQRQQADTPAAQRLRIAMIYSYAANGADPDENGFYADENSDSAAALSQPDRDALDAAIADYNRMFQTNFSTDGDGFQNYYKDVSQRMKERQLDMLIVVNMFLTGFDATTLNTLWVDKNLRMHGLLQAYSRTNRILNSVKTFGNIVCFRNLAEATDEAIALFGDEKAGGVVILRPFNDYMYGYDLEDKHYAGYVELVSAIETMSIFEHGLQSEQDEREFIRLFSALLRVQNVLACFDQFYDANAVQLSERRLANYKSLYLDLRDKYRHTSTDAEDIHDDITFEIELIKQVEINIAYILREVERLHDKNTQDKEIEIQRILEQVDAAPDLREKRDLIEAFIRRYDAAVNIDDDWQNYIHGAQKEELERIIEEEKLQKEPTYQYMRKAFQNGYVDPYGTEIVQLLPPTSRSFFAKQTNKEENRANKNTSDQSTKAGSDRAKKKATVVEKLKAFFQRFYEISTSLYTK